MIYCIVSFVILITYVAEPEPTERLRNNAGNFRGLI